MPRIIVEADDSAREVVFWERVGAEDFDADHFRNCLCDRLAWAVADAESAGDEPARFDREVEEKARSLPAVRDQVSAALASARHTGWDGLLAQQRRYLDDFWERADVEI